LLKTRPRAFLKQAKTSEGREKPIEAGKSGVELVRVENENAPPDCSSGALLHYF
jgi:hypothetical protein